MRRYLLLGVALALSGCASLYTPPDTNDNAAARKPASPFRAFEKVGHPVRPAGGSVGQPRTLSTTIQRLQDARRAYQAELRFEAARRRHRQKACRKSPEGEEVPIADGSGKPATYCQKIPGDETATGDPSTNK